jgi:hypothetical protein
MTLWTNLAYRALEPAEREVVCGDLCEVGENGWLALREVLGLVIRRRVLNYDFARSCLTIGTLTVLTTLLLTLLAVRIVDGSAIYLWMWINNSDSVILQTAGFWNPVLEVAPGLIFSYIALACCSWTCGLLLGWSSRRTRWLSAVLLPATVVWIAICGLPESLGHILIQWSARDYFGNETVFQGISYRSVLPATIELFLVVLPTWWGIRRSSTLHRFKVSARFFLLLLCFGAFGFLVAMNLIWPRIQIVGIWPLRYARLPEIAPTAILVPIAYCFLLVLHRLNLRTTDTG